MDHQDKDLVLGLGPTKRNRLYELYGYLVKGVMSGNNLVFIMVCQLGISREAAVRSSAFRHYYSGEFTSLYSRVYDTKAGPLNCYWLCYASMIC